MIGILVIVGALYYFDLGPVLLARMQSFNNQCRSIIPTVGRAVGEPICGRSELRGKWDQPIGAGGGAELAEPQATVRIGTGHAFVAGGDVGFVAKRCGEP